jgi:ribosomal protein S21
MAKKRPANVTVTLREVKGDPYRLIKKFIKKTKKEKIIEEFRSRMFYEKPSSKRRRERMRKKENARKAEVQRKKKLNS